MLQVSGPSVMLPEWSHTSAAASEYFNDLIDAIDTFKP